MYSEPFYEEAHYIIEDFELIEREVAPIEIRINNQNLWQGNDWHCYYQGKSDSSLGIPARCNNPFYLQGYKEVQDKYQKNNL